jgi:FixJ family two-component response regulator
VEFADRSLDPEYMHSRNQVILMLRREVEKLKPTLRSFRDQDLLDAIQQALQRDRAVREQQAEAHDLHGRYQALTAREREVMGFVISGLLNKQIASEIGASEATVKIHRGNLMQKMQAGSLIELVRMADKLKLVLPR